MVDNDRNTFIDSLESVEAIISKTAKTNTIFDSIPIKQLPYKDSIQDWNNKNYQNISNRNVNFLDLEKVTKIFAIKPTYKKFKIICRLNLSNNYYSIIVNYKGWDTEIFNFLINYDKHFKVISILETAYDEIAESASGSYSIIEENLVTHFYWNNLGEKYTKKIIYDISKDGKFTEKIASR